jgi:hypothetical protein
LRFAGLPECLPGNCSVFASEKAEEDITTINIAGRVLLPGYGWVCADPLMRRQCWLKTELDDPKTKTSGIFLGRIDAYRVVFAVGRDIVLNPPQAGAPLNTIGYPYAEIGGTAVDFYQPKSFVYTYNFKGK